MQIALLMLFVSLVWFAIGAGVAGWMMHVGRTGASPLPRNPFKKSEHVEPTNGEVRPRVSIPSRAGN